jgi:hypothetical protein
MDKKATHIKGLFYAQGDVFDLEGGGFDAIVVFMEPGFNNIQGRFLQLKEELEKSPVLVIPFGNYVECKNNFKLNQIHSVVFQVLDAVKSHHRKTIGFHGIRAIDASDYMGAKYTVNAIIDWLRYNRNCIESITLVDAKLL